MLFREWIKLHFDTNCRFLGFHDSLWTLTMTSKRSDTHTSFEVHFTTQLRNESTCAPIDISPISWVGFLLFSILK